MYDKFFLQKCRLNYLNLYNKIIAFIFCIVQITKKFQFLDRKNVSVELVGKFKSGVSNCIKITMYVAVAAKI